MFQKIFNVEIVLRVEKCLEWYKDTKRLLKQMGVQKQTCEHMDISFMTGDTTQQ